MVIIITAGFLVTLDLVGELRESPALGTERGKLLSSPSSLGTQHGMKPEPKW
jgi:hypothetical protein